MSAPDERRPAAPLGETITVNDTPGAPNGTLPADPGQVVRVTADARKEYVSAGTGGSWAWYANVARAISWAIDDITTDFGDDLYERMALDPQIAADTTILKGMILEDGVNLAPAVDDEDEPDYALAASIAEAAEEMFAALTTPLDTWLWDMLSAVTLGNRVSEQTFDYVTGADGRVRLDVVALRVKPRRMLSFVVDAYNRVLGFLARIPGQGLPPLQTILVDLANVPNLLPRDKFAVLTFRPREGDPRGTSILRPAYTPWYQKQQIIREHLKYLAQFASPLLIGYTPENAIPYVDPANPTADPISAQQLMANQLAGVHNGTAAAFSFGAKVDYIQSQGNGEAFLHALDLYDRQISKCILGQTLAQGEGQHQARAAAQVHQDILDTLVRQAKRDVCQMIVRDILTPWAVRNWGERARRLVPLVTLGVTETPDLPRTWTAAAALQTSGYFAPSQYASLDTMLNLPARLPEETAALAPAKLDKPTPEQEQTGDDATADDASQEQS